MRLRFALFNAALSLGTAVALTGFTSIASAQAQHEHAEEGPHNGHLIELGEEEFHAELVHDDDKGTVTIYILDKKAVAPVEVDNDQVVINLVIDAQPKQFMLKTVQPGKRNQFESRDKALGEALDKESTKGRLNVSIANKPYVGKIEHHEHEHEHDHK